MSAYTRPYPLPHLILGTLGPRGHGRTTLARALAAARPCPSQDAADPARGRYRYATDTRRCTVLDDPATVLDEATGEPVRLDGAVLVVSVVDGARPGAAEQVVRACRAARLPLVVAATMAEEGREELTELVECEVRALLSAHGYAGETLPFVWVSARRALEGDPRWQGAIEALLDAVDTYVPLPGAGPGSGAADGERGSSGPCAGAR